MDRTVSLDTVNHIICGDVTSFSPFAKRQEKNPAFIDRFQLVIGGIEMVNAFSELNDPLEQKARYEEQDKKKKGGEGDVSPSDDDTDFCLVSTLRGRGGGGGVALQ